MNHLPTYIIYDDIQVFSEDLHISHKIYIYQKWIDKSTHKMEAPQKSRLLEYA